MQLKNKNKLIQLVIVSFLIFVSGKSLANDSIYIKFIDKTIDISTYKYGKIKVKKVYYLVTHAREENVLNCFVFRSNKLIASGNLTVNHSGELDVAMRNGYWIFFNNKKKSKRLYFSNDELFKEDELPIQEKNNLYYNK